MFAKRPAAERGQYDYGWLKTAHTFSFNEYHDARYHHFRTLRVINEDHVAPGQGFGEHGHRDMEIITLIQQGMIAHRDSLGHVETLSPGEVQCMTAGHGIRHSEFNPSATEPLHLYQIWIMPEAKGLTPGYQQQRFDSAAGQNQWQLLVSRDGASGSLKIHQDAQLWRTRLSPHQSLKYQLQSNRHAWIQLLNGQIQVQSASESVTLDTSDGLAISDVSEITITATQSSEVILFDLS